MKDDNTWYGTTFNFGGSWINNPPNVSNVRGAIYGNYRVSGSRKGYANSAITISLPTGDRTKLVADWYDWFDDLSYQTYVTALLMARVKDNCDPPFTGQNAQAATQ